MESRTVGIISGGLSHERDVSLASGRMLASALQEVGVETRIYDFDRDLIERLAHDGVSVAVPTIHGTSGEDGEVQSLLSLLGIPFVGSPASACRIAYNKLSARAVFQRHGLPTSDGIALAAQTFRDLGAQQLMDAVVARLGNELVVKPTEGGSALGLERVRSAEELPAALVHCYSYCSAALIEPFVPGRDISVCVVERDSAPTALEPIAVSYETDRQYDFGGRYTAGLMSVESPAAIPDEVAAALQDAAVRAHVALGLRDLSRTDFIVDDDGSFVVLETAVTPGMTETSLFPISARTSGIGLGRLLADLVDQAAARGL